MIDRRAIIGKCNQSVDVRCQKLSLSLLLVYLFLFRFEEASKKMVWVTCGMHHLPGSAHLLLFWRKKKHQVSSSRHHHKVENITRVNSLHTASDSLILMAINALVAIW
jgi:hypothetical protein